MADLAIQQHPRFRLRAAVDLVMAMFEIEADDGGEHLHGGQLRALRVQPSEAHLTPIGLTGRVVHVVHKDAAARMKCPWLSGSSRSAAAARSTYATGTKDVVVRGA